MVSLFNKLFFYFRLKIKYLNYKIILNLEIGLDPLVHYFYIELTFLLISLQMGLLIGIAFVANIFSLFIHSTKYNSRNCPFFDNPLTNLIRMSLSEWLSIHHYISTKSFSNKLSNYEIQQNALPQQQILS